MMKRGVASSDGGSHSQLLAPRRSGGLDIQREACLTHYELIWIGAASLTPEEVERIGQGIEATIKDLGGTLLKVERWGKKKLAYKVRKNEEGYYTYYLIEGKHTVVDEAVRRIRMNDQILKFLSVRVDLEAVTRAANRRPAREDRDSAVPPEAMDEDTALGGY